MGVGLVGAYGCRWAKGEARVGEAVGMSARCAGIVDGTAAVFEVWREGADGGAVRAKVGEGTGEVRGDRVEADAPFVFAWDPETDGGGDAGGASASRPELTGEVGPPPRPPSAPDAPETWAPSASVGAQAPTYVVEVSVGGVHRARGGRLRYQDWTEAEVVGADGQPVADALVDLVWPGGEVRRGQADPAGVVRVEGVPPGPYTISDVRLP